MIFSATVVDLVPTARGHRSPPGPPPTATVARSFDGGAPRLGLDRPFALLGGGALVPSILPGALGLDWLPGLQDMLGRTSLTLARDGVGFFRSPPISLRGPDGSGRRHVASRIARRVGVPLLVIDVGGIDGAGRLLPPSRDDDYAPPSPVVMCMAATRCANPMVLIEGVERAYDEAIDLLASMMDRRICADWTENSIGASIDLRGISWLLQLSEHASPPAGIAHLVEETADVGRPDGDHQRLRSLSILLEVMEDLRPVDIAHDDLNRLLDRMTRCGIRDARNLYDLAHDQLLGITR